MNRRTLLAALAGVVVAGCTTDQSSQSSPTASPSPTARATATTTTAASGLDYSLTTGDPSASSSTTDGPAIAFHESAGTVSITGQLFYGSSTCDEIVVQALERTDDGLRVVVGYATREDAPQTCTDDMARAQYELVVTVEEPFPGVVTVVERPATGDQRRRRVTPTG